MDENQIHLIFELDSFMLVISIEDVDLSLHLILTNLIEMLDLLVESITYLLILDLKAFSSAIKDLTFIHFLAY